MEQKQQSVMLEESIDLLDIRPDGIYVDGTLGRGGHSSRILEKLDTGHLYAFDLDQQAIDESRPRLEAISDRFTLIHAPFETMKEELAKRDITSVDGIFLDLGVSSPQFDDPSRGFSYRFDSRLDMRMDQGQDLDAWTIVNTWSPKEIEKILRDYGEEPFAGPISRAIAKAREEKPIDTTFELVDVIKSALPAKVLSKKGHPAKRSFQAFRIAVNRELDQLDHVLDDALSLLKPDGRLAILTFHSLEDRKVKKAFQAVAKKAKGNRRMPVAMEKEPDYELLNKKAITASEQELEANSRSHSAKLRGIRKK